MSAWRGYGRRRINLAEMEIALSRSTGTGLADAWQPPHFTTLDLDGATDGVRIVAPEEQAERSR